MTLMSLFICEVVAKSIFCVFEKRVCMFIFCVCIIRGPIISSRAVRVRILGFEMRSGALPALFSRVVCFIAKSGNAGIPF